MVTVLTTACPVAAVARRRRVSREARLPRWVTTIAAVALRVSVAAPRRRVRGHRRRRWSERRRQERAAAPRRSPLPPEHAMANSPGNGRCRGGRHVATDHSCNCTEDRSRGTAAEQPSDGSAAAAGARGGNDRRPEEAREGLTPQLAAAPRHASATARIALLRRHAAATGRESARTARWPRSRATRIRPGAATVARPPQERRAVEACPAGATHTAQSCRYLPPVVAPQVTARPPQRMRPAVQPSATSPSHVRPLRSRSAPPHPAPEPQRAQPSPRRRRAEQSAPPTPAPVARPPEPVQAPARRSPSNAQAARPAATTKVMNPARATKNQAQGSRRCRRCRRR